MGGGQQSEAAVAGARPGVTGLRVPALGTAVAPGLPGEHTSSRPCHRPRKVTHPPLSLPGRLTLVGDSDKPHARMSTKNAFPFSFGSGLSVGRPVQWGDRLPCVESTPGCRVPPRSPPASLAQLRGRGRDGPVPHASKPRPGKAPLHAESHTVPGSRRSLPAPKTVCFFSSKIKSDLQDAFVDASFLGSEVSQWGEAGGGEGAAWPAGSQARPRPTRAGRRSTLPAGRSPRCRRKARPWPQRRQRQGWAEKLDARMQPGCLRCQGRAHEGGEAWAKSPRPSGGGSSAARPGGESSSLQGWVAAGAASARP